MISLLFLISFLKLTSQACFPTSGEKFLSGRCFNITGSRIFVLNGEKSTSRWITFEKNGTWFAYDDVIYSMNTMLWKSQQSKIYLNMSHSDSNPGDGFSLDFTLIIGDASS